MKQRIEKGHFIAAICYVLAAIFQWGRVTRLTKSSFTFVGFVSILMLLLFLYLAFCLAKKSRDKLLLYGLAGGAVVSFLFLVTSFSFYNVLLFLGWGALLALSLPLTLGKLEEQKELFEKAWFAPAVAIALYGFIYFISLWSYYGSYFYYAFASAFTGILLPALCAAVGAFFTAQWFLFYDVEPVKKERIEAKGEITETMGETDLGDGYCDMTKHILLLLFTCGIWMMMWIYRTTERLNGVAGSKHRNPAVTLICYLFVPFYSIYWVYVMAKNVDAAAREKGISSDIATLCLIMAFLFPIANPIIMQDKLNAIAKGKGVAKDVSAKPVESQADELKKYKALLDDGAISEEEYEAKKKQLLGL